MIPMRNVQLFLLKERLPVPPVSRRILRGKELLAAYDAVLKRFYLPEIKKMFEQESVLGAIFDRVMKREEERTNRYHRHVPWWRRVTGLVMCPCWGGVRMKVVRRQKIWVCLTCNAWLIHKKGGKKYES